MATVEPVRVELSVVDSDRLRALAQEAQGCFDEMAEIASRARGMPFGRTPPTAILC